METLKHFQIIIDLEIGDDFNSLDETVNINLKEIENTVNKIRYSLSKYSSVNNHLHKEYENSRSKIELWQRRAELAVLAKNDYLATEALLRKRYFKRNATELKTKIKLNKNSEIITDLQQILNTLEMKIVDLKISQIETELTISSELDNKNNIDLGKQFAQLEFSSNSDDEEINAMKKLISDTSAETSKREIANIVSTAIDVVIDAELDELRMQLNK